MGSNVEIAEILQELEVDTGVFPRRALEDAVVAKEQITPELIRIIEDATRNIEEVARQDQEEYMAHFYAMYLLAQFREKRAYPAIAAFFSIPGEITLDVTGDLVTEDLGRILASVCHGDTSLIEGLIENRDANEYVRDAGLCALVTLVVCGEKSREEVVAYFASLFREKLEREPSHLWGGLVSASTELYAAELLSDIERAFEEEMVDTSFINLEWVTEHLALGPERVLADTARDSHRQLIGNAVNTLESWACFGGSLPKPAEATATAPPPAGASAAAPQPVRAGMGVAQPVATSRKTQPPPAKQRKIGRNEPCPCGSGKKYKRCCLR